MNRLDLIIDALENSEPTGTGWVHIYEQKHQAALAAACELRDLQPVGMASKHIYRGAALFDGVVLPEETLLYAFDEVKHD